MNDQLLEMTTPTLDSAVERVDEYRASSGMDVVHNNTKNIYLICNTNKVPPSFRVELLIVEGS